MASLNPRSLSQKARQAEQERVQNERIGQGRQNRNQGGQGRGNDRAPDRQPRKAKRR